MSHFSSSLLLETSLFQTTRAAGKKVLTKQHFMPTYILDMSLEIKLCGNIRTSWVFGQIA